MKKLIVLGFIFLIGTQIGFAMSPMHPMHPLSPTQMMLRTATMNSTYNTTKTRERKQALQNCLKNKGGKACYVKYKK